MKIILTVDSMVRFDWGKLTNEDPDCAATVLKKFTKNNPKIYQLKSLGYSTRGIPQKFYSYHYHKPILRVFRGGYGKIKKILKDHGHKVITHDNRIELSPVQYNSQIKVREEQEAPIAAILKRQQGLVRGPPASGKTIILLEAIARISQPACVVVWSTVHQKQWIKAATDPKLLNMLESDVGGVGGVFSSPKVKQLNICMQQSLYSLWTKKELSMFSDNCGVLAADECQRFSARTFQAVINEFPAKYRIGCSANEKRSDRCQFLIYDSFGKVIHKMDDSNIGSRLKASCVLVPTQFYFGDYEYNPRCRSQMITTMCQDAERNELLLKLVKRSIKKGKMCLILTERREHAVWLKIKLQKYSTGLLIGATNIKELSNILLDFNSEEEEKRIKELASEKNLDVVIATQKGDVGLNIPNLDHLFIVCPTAGNMERFDQQKGRVERDAPGKKTPKVYYFWDCRMDRLRDAGNNITSRYPKTKIRRG